MITRQSSKQGQEQARKVMEALHTNGIPWSHGCANGTCPLVPTLQQEAAYTPK